MSKQVISFVSDTSYFDHARSAMVNCKRQGGWTDDFCMITPETGEAEDFKRRGIWVLEVPESEWNFMVKFHIFTSYFHRWDYALCIDLDVMAQGPIHKIFDDLSKRTPRILCVREDGSTLEGLKRWDEISGDGLDAHPELYVEIERRWPHVNERMYNMAFIFYAPATIPEDTVDCLQKIHEEFKEANPSNADQMLINLHLYSKLEEAGKDYFCFFGGDYPENRVTSESRNWRGDEEPVFLHYTRWHAPWIEKYIYDGVEMGGYRNHRLGRICHELYAENLAAFDDEFPLK